jgi:uncharacterized protein (TIGR00251 family)
MVKILVLAHPGAKKNEVLRCENGVWHIKVAALPVEGKANKKLIEFLSEILDISKNRILIEKGGTSKNKMIAVEGLALADIESKLRQVTQSRLL